MTPGAYSYRADPAVPPFPDDRPLVLFDGQCALCSGSARFIVRHDRAGRFRLAPVQSTLGRSLLAHYGVDPADPSTMLVIEDGVACARSSAVLRIAAGLPAPFSWGGVLRAVPSGLRDGLYLWIARRRRRFPGQTWCAMPDTGSDSGPGTGDGIAGRLIG